jgi:hypothetical protein
MIGRQPSAGGAGAGAGAGVPPGGGAPAAVVIALPVSRAVNAAATRFSTRWRWPEDEVEHQLAASAGGVFHDHPDRELPFARHRPVPVCCPGHRVDTIIERTRPPEKIRAGKPIRARPAPRPQRETGKRLAVIAHRHSARLHDHRQQRRRRCWRSPEHERQHQLAARTSSVFHHHPNRELALTRHRAVPVCCPRHLVDTVIERARPPEKVRAGKPVGPCPAPRPQRETGERLAVTRLRGWP